MKPYYEYNGVTIFHGHVMDLLKNMDDESIQCCVTSPPYWGLRDYGVEPQVWDDHGGCEHEWRNRQKGRISGGGTRNPDTIWEGVERTADKAKPRYFCIKCGAWLGSLGLEPTPELYIQHITKIFYQVRRVLKRNGTLWLNLGDSYTNKSQPGGGDPTIRKGNIGESQYTPTIVKGLDPKNLLGMPWRVAFALQADGWWLRSDIIWDKPNPMPESVKDRPTRSHEYLFLLSKSRKYYYDNEAIKEKASPESHARYARGRSDHHKWADGGPGNQTIAKSLEHMKPGVNPKASRTPSGWDTGPGGHRDLTGRYRPKQNESFSFSVKDLVEYRNKRSVWRITTKPNPEAHFATFPEKLVEPCILAGSAIGDTVLDPFGGILTTGRVAKRLNRKAVLIELKEDYIKMGIKYLAQGVLPFGNPSQ